MVQNRSAVADSVEFSKFQLWSSHGCRVPASYVPSTCQIVISGLAEKIGSLRFFILVIENAMRRVTAGPFATRRGARHCDETLRRDGETQEMGGVSPPFSDGSQMGGVSGVA